MKRRLTIAFLALAAPQPAHDPAMVGPIKVVASLPDLGSIAAAVGGDRVAVTTLASGMQDPHFVDAKPTYMVQLRDAELFLVNGLELEVGWVPALIEGARNGRIKIGGAGYVDCSQDVPVIELPTGALTRAEGDVHPYGNPHYTTDPLNGKIVAATVAAAFTRARPADAAYFAERLKAFQKSLDEATFGKDLVDLVGGAKLDRLARSGELEGFLAQQSADGAPLAAKLGGWLGRMHPFAGAQAVFYHRSFSYFNARFGLKVPDYIELKPGIQPGPSHLADVVALIRAEAVKVVVMHPFQDEKIARLVAEQGGARLVILPLQTGGAEGAKDYLSFFESITTELAGALGR